MASDPNLTEEDDLVAAEYVLRLLNAGELAKAESRIAAEPAFAALVDGWQARLEPLFDEIPDAVAPGDGWTRLRHLLALEPPAPTAANDNSRGWKLATFAASAVAAALALALFMQPQPAPLTPVLVASEIAQLTGDNPDLLFSAKFEPVTGTLRVRSDGLDIAADKAPELWVIPADGVPRSLGLVAKTGTSEIRVAKAVQPFLVGESILAVTIENSTTAPHAAPSTTPVAVGKLQTL